MGRIFPWSMQLGPTPIYCHPAPSRCLKRPKRPGFLLRSREMGQARTTHESLGWAVRLPVRGSRVAHVNVMPLPAVRVQLHAVSAVQSDVQVAFLD